MKIIDLWITVKTIFLQVQHESVEIAKRRTNQQGQTLYSQLVMDSDHTLLFRNYFQEARTNILTKYTAYTKYHPTTNGEDTDNITGKDEDFFVTLILPFTFPPHSVPILHNITYEYLITWVLYRWFETKLPNEALLLRQRAELKLNEITSILEHRTHPSRRRYRLF